MINKIREKLYPKDQLIVWFNHAIKCCRIFLAYKLVDHNPEYQIFSCFDENS